MTRQFTVILGALLAAAPITATAQTAAPPAIEEPDPDRVQAARELLDLIMPPEQRETMMLAMIEPSMANIEQGLMESPQFMEAMREDPETQQLFIEMLQRQRAATSELLAASLPDLIAVMSRAYARRFTVRQLRDMEEFFESDTGQAYLHEAPAIMADPDVATWQRGVMVQAMALMENDIEALMARAGARGSTSPSDGSVTDSNLDAMRGGGEDVQEDNTEE
ncbi:MAG: DUF2059 domain-containing protein [Pseudomonadota bacterium]